MNSWINQLEREMRTLDQAKELAIDIADYAKTKGVATEMEVALATRKNADGDIYRIQPAGMYKLFRTQKLIFTTGAVQP